MTPIIEQLTLDFARLVAGLDAELTFDKDATPRVATRTVRSFRQVPDYPSDWNATIRAIEARGWTFNIMSGPKIHRDACIAFDYYGHGEFDEPPCVALMRAAVEAAKAGER